MPTTAAVLAGAYVLDQLHNSAPLLIKQFLVGESETSFFMCVWVQVSLQRCSVKQVSRAMVISRRHCTGAASLLLYLVTRVNRLIAQLTAYSCPQRLRYQKATAVYFQQASEHDSIR